MSCGTSTRRIFAGICTWATVLISMWLPVMLPPFLTDRALADGHTVSIICPLSKRPSPNPLRVPYEYTFEVDGKTYRGSEFLSEDAVVWDDETESASARVVFSRQNPKHHRMEPVTTIGGIRWVSIFPWLVVIVVGLTLTAWLAASWEHLDRLVKMLPSNIRPEDDALITLLNLATAIVIVVCPAASIAALLGWVEGNAFYVPYRGWATAAAVIGLAALVALAAASRRLEAKTS